MPWSVPRVDHQTYDRNPLSAVIFQLRFHPILMISEGSKIAEFQESVRKVFPGFEKAQTREVSVQPDGIQVREGQDFRFVNKTRTALLSLGQGALALENRAHTSHVAFFEDLQFALSALFDIYAPVSPVRVGLRYVNEIDRDQIGQDMGPGTTVGWEKLIAPEFIGIPSGLAGIGDSHFSCEVTSPSTTLGMMTLRYGLLPAGPEKSKFRLDIDRYVEEEVKPAQLTDILESFTDDVYCVFRAAAGEQLLRWMGERA